MECNPFFCFPDTPPDGVDSKGPGGVQRGVLLGKKVNQNEFAAPLKDMCVQEPGACCLSALGTPFGCTACYTRKLVLDSYYNGVNDFVCCQGYIPMCCCVEPAGILPGSAAGLFFEGCLCPVFSLSIARIHLMDTKKIRPDPMDYQIIAFANCLQLLSCICDIASICVQDLRDAALAIDVIADLLRTNRLLQ